ncbi:MAG: glutathione S-transferase N-terminal domain-containing protein [Rhodobacteraceae bacterium]|nr:glutathione S-transferase N-terminal domain-containing protein [Paracoccaceae bacterium]
MNALSAFPVTRRWPPRNPRAIQFYATASPNALKVATMLEETGLPYDAHLVSFDAKDQFTPEFLSLNPNGKIPAIIDPEGPDGRPLPLWESGAILLYLAERTGRFIPPDAAGRWRAIQWLMFQMGGVGPIFGQVGHFHRWAGRAIEDPRPRQRYFDEARRLLGVLDGQLGNRDWLLGDYSIVDMAVCPWLRQLRSVYLAGAETGLDAMPRILAWLDRFLARPAVQRALAVPARPCP